jgi:Flp pilus assembly protein TadG
MLEAIFTIPVVMFMIFGILQAGMWWYGRQLALTAAQEGARAARAYQASDADGTAQAVSYLRQVQGGSGPALADPSVSVLRSGDTVTVVVRGQVPSLLPGLTVSVEASSSGPVEAFVPVGGR